MTTTSPDPLSHISSDARQTAPVKPAGVPLLSEAAATPAGTVMPLRTPAAVQQQPAPQGAVTMTAKIDPQQEGITSTFDEDCVIDGNITSKRGIYLRGKINGNVRVDGDENGNGTVIVGTTAVVNGVVAAKRVVLQGQVNGGVVARGMLDLADTAVLRGHGLYNMMRQAEGAEIDGTFRKIKSPEDGDIDRLIATVQAEKK